MSSSRAKARIRKSKPPAHPVAALLLDLRRQGFRISPADGGRLRLQGPEGFGALDAQVRVQVNKPGLLELLAGQDACRRLGLEDAWWWVHLETVAGNGTRPPVPRPDKGPEGASKLPDTVDDPPDPTTIASGEPIAIDIETMSLVPPWIPGARIISVAFSAVGLRWAFPIEAQEAIQRYLALPNPKVFHNSSFDLAYLIWAGFEIAA